MNYLIYLQRCRTTRCSVLAVFIFAFSLLNFVPHYPFLRFHCSFCAYSIRFWDVRAYNLTLFVHVLSLFVLPLSLFVLCFHYLFMFSCAFTIRSFLALSLLVLWFRYSFSAYRIRFLSFHNLILCFHYSFLPFHCSFVAFTIRSWYYSICVCAFTIRSVLAVFVFDFLLFNFVLSQFVFALSLFVLCLQYSFFNFCAHHLSIFVLSLVRNT